MDEDGNLFAEATTVGQLFDKLWYDAVTATLVEGVLAAKEERTFSEANVQRRRERAIGDAHKRYLELAQS